MMLNTLTSCQKTKGKAFTSQTLGDPTSILTSGVGLNCVDRLADHLRCVMPPAGKSDDTQTSRLVDLIFELQDVFVGPDGKVGHNTLLKHHSGDSQPFNCHPRTNVHTRQNMGSNHIKYAGMVYY